MPDAITLLKQDHKEVEALFKRFEKLGDKASASKRTIVQDVIKALSQHAVIEEQVFYPAIREHVEDVEDLVLEALEEHHVVKWTLQELLDMSPDHERYTAKFTVLMESVRHHVEEEESDLFPKVRAAIGRKALQEMGAAMETARTAAPTKPQPTAPDTPPGNLVTETAAAAKDTGVKAAKTGVRRLARSRKG